MKTKQFALTLALIPAWLIAYFLNEPLWARLFGAPIDGPHSLTALAALHFFLADSIKIFLLLSGIIFLVGLARASLNSEKARDFLRARSLASSLVLAVILGIVTPFCSCSSIPLFIGFTAAGIPLAITLTFLVASPLISETAAILIGAQFGWSIALAYVAAGAAISLLIGFVLSRFNLDKYIDPKLRNLPVAALGSGPPPSFSDRLTAAKTEVREILSRVGIWVVVGVAIGAIIHGWVPASFFATYLADSGPWSVPLAAIAGVPLYANGGAVVPIGQALWAKGVPLGTVMALMMSSIALSIPEAIMLRTVMRPRLLAIFFATVTAGIIVVGYLFNYLQ